MIKYIDQVNSMQVKLIKDYQVDKYIKKGSSNYIVEVIICLLGIEFFVQVLVDDMYMLIKKLLEKLKRQFDKYCKMQ